MSNDGETTVLKQNDTTAINKTYSSFEPDDHRKENELLIENKKNVETAAPTTTALQTCISIFKGNVGPGCLALPWAFSILGIPLGCAITSIMTALVGWNAWTLVKLKRHFWGLEERGISYADVGEKIFGTSFRIVVDISVITVQLAVCTVWFSNMGENVSAVVRASFGTAAHEVDESKLLEHSLVAIFGDARAVMTLLLPPTLALSFLPNLKVLAPAIGFATVLMFMTFGLIGVVIGSNWSIGISEWRERGGFSEDVQWNLVPLATCVIMYSLEGDQLILPIESAMERPQVFGRVFTASMVLIGVLFCSFGSLCVVAFGHVDDGSLPAFLLDHNSELADFKAGSGNGISTLQIVLVANIIVSLSLLFAYPLQLFPALGLTGQIVARRQKANREEEMKGEGTKEGNVCISMDDDECSGNEEAVSGMALEGDSLFLRFVLVMITYLVAMVVPHLQQLIALAGAITGAATSLIIPPTLALRFVIADFLLDVKGNDESHTWGSLFLGALGSKKSRFVLFNVVLIVTGWFYGIFGTISSVKDLIDVYRPSN